jgi:hypothetical protein
MKKSNPDGGKSGRGAGSNKGKNEKSAPGKSFSKSAPANKAPNRIQKTIPR